MSERGDAGAPIQTVDGREASGAGMTESQVSDIECGKNNPGWLLLIRLLVDGLDADLGDLVDAYKRAAESEKA